MTEIIKPATLPCITLFFKCPWLIEIIYFKVIAIKRKASNPSLNPMIKLGICVIIFSLNVYKIIITNIALYY